MRIKVFKATQWTGAETRSVEDRLPVEAVLQIKVNGVPYTTTVRTPGADQALARGLLHTEAVLTGPEIRPEFREITDPATGIAGCLEVSVPAAAVAKPLADRRSAMGSASCGLCGIREPEELELRGAPLVPPPGRGLSRACVAQLLDALPDHQPIFQATGGVHAALAFAIDGTILSSHEDIGRHNAVDKVIGDLILRERLASACGVLVSGRVSYEIVYKACQARWPYLIAVSAPSSLAIEMAEAFGLCVVAFCRPRRATVYSHPDYLSD